MDIELIRNIVREVLNESGGSTPAPVSSASVPIALGGKTNVSSKARQIVTAETIQQLADTQKTIELPRSTILTPLARDLVTQRKITVRWVDLPVEPVTVSNPPAGQPKYQQVSATVKGPILITYDNKTIAVKQLLDALGRENSPIGIVEDAATDAALPQRIESLAGQLRSGAISSGIMLVESAEFALAYVNKFKGIRAALGSDWQSVHRAIESIGANVLVIDYAGKTFYQLLQLLRNFVRAQANDNSVGQWQAVLDRM